MPLGDMVGTMHTLITFNAGIDFLYTYRIDEREFVLDTKEFRDRITSYNVCYTKLLRILDT